MHGQVPLENQDPPRDGPPPEQGVPPAGPSARSLLIAAVLMVAIGYFLTVKLREMSHLQDCALSGRSNCASVEGARQ